MTQSMTGWDSENVFRVDCTGASSRTFRADWAKMYLVAKSTAPTAKAMTIMNFSLLIVYLLKFRYKHIVIFPEKKAGKWK